MKRRIARGRLLSLWRQYTQFQTPQLAPSTIKRDYAKIERLLQQRLPDHLTTSIEIRDWLLQNYAAESTRRILMQLNACCQWAVESDLISVNPFSGLGKRIRRKTGQNTWVGFTALERDAIIERFDSDHPAHAAWVKFLFWTGCRPEEAAGLLWENVTPDDRQIRFCQALPSGIHEQQTTKTGKSRVFPANSRLQGLLKTLRGNHPTRVFCGLMGGSFEYHNFQTRQWKPTIETLVAEGKVSLYLPQGHCRHTFITLALDYLPVKDVAYLVGNSPEIIYRHYASRSRNLEVPEF